MKSLAESLGIIDPAKPDVPAAPISDRKLTAKQFAALILDSTQYQESLLRRILLHELPAQVEVLLYHYRYGKPVEHVEIKDTTDPLENVSADRLEARALYLAEMARRLRMNDEVTPSSDADDSATPSVH